MLVCVSDDWEDASEFLSTLFASLNLSKDDADALLTIRGFGYEPELFAKRLDDANQRWVFLWNFLLLSIAGGTYSSTHRASLRTLSTALDVPFQRVEAAEDGLALSLQKQAKQEISREGTASSGRWWKIGLGAAVGGGALAITGGLAAPIVIPAFGAFAAAIAGTASTVGLGALATATTVVSGVTLSGGTALMAGLFGAAGAGLTGVKVAHRTGGVDEFEFVEISAEGVAHLLHPADSGPLAATKKWVSNIPYFTASKEQEAEKERLAALLWKDLDEEEEEEPAINDLYRLTNRAEDETSPQKSTSDNEESHIKDGCTDGLDEATDQNLEVQNAPSEPPKTTDSPPKSPQYEMEGRGGHPLSGEQSEVTIKDRLKQAPISRGMHIWICVSGILTNDVDFVEPWITLEEMKTFGEYFALRWESEKLKNLGNFVYKFIATTAAKKLATYWMAASGQALLVAISSVASAIAWPLTILSITGVIDNTWHVLMDRAEKAGKLLGKVLMDRVHGNRPVSLVGYSVGARVIYYCLRYLTEHNAKGIVMDAFLLGTPVSTSPEDWQACKSIVAGRLVNAYSRSDWLLGVLYRAAHLSFGVAGLEAIACEEVENIDVSSVITGHLQYRSKLRETLLLLRLNQQSASPLSSPPQSTTSSSADTTTDSRDFVATEQQWTSSSTDESNEQTNDSTNMTNQK
ncbi:Transmembrane and coiled-coil domain-containing protein 4 [Balamuthia mandrillaris]